MQELIKSWNYARNQFTSYAMKVTYGHIQDREINTKNANFWDTETKRLRDQIHEQEINK